MSTRIDAARIRKYKRNLKRLPKGSFKYNYSAAKLDEIYVSYEKAGTFGELQQALG